VERVTRNHIDEVVRFVHEKYKGKVMPWGVGDGGGGEGVYYRFKGGGERERGCLLETNPCTFDFARLCACVCVYVSLTLSPSLSLSLSVFIHNTGAYNELGRGGQQMYLRLCSLPSREHRHK
jgi:hypothetical protein